MPAAIHERPECVHRGLRALAFGAYDTEGPVVCVLAGTFGAILCQVFKEGHFSLV
jgi:hypothetical protein